MNEEDLFVAAKLEIFGNEPIQPATRIARNMAIKYLSPVIKEAEAVQLGMRMPHISLATELSDAFGFSSDPVMSYFPEEAKRALEEYTDNFRARYERLLEELSAKAA